MNKLHATACMSLVLDWLIFVGPAITSAEDILLLDESFETDGQGIRYTASTPFNVKNSDNGDYWDRGEIGDFKSLVPYANPDGSYFWAAEDTNASSPGGNGNEIQTIGFNTIDIAGATDLEFSGLFASTANDFFGPGFPFHEPDDGIIVQYSIDGGAYQDGLCFSRNDDSNLALDNGCDGTGDGGLLTADFTGASNPYAFAIPDGSTLDLRILVKADETSEELAFDSLQVVPEPGATLQILSGVGFLGFLAGLRRCEALLRRTNRARPDRR